MPSGKTHMKINIVAFPILIIALTMWGVMDRVFYLFFGIGFILGTYFLTPDMDIKSDTYRNWGPLRFIWFFYLKMIPHRSFLSHSIFFGDIVRITYFVLILSPVWYLLNKYVLDGKLLDMIIPYQTNIGIAILGIMASSTLHIVADVISTKSKRMKTKRRKRAG